MNTNFYLHEVQKISLYNFSLDQTFDFDTQVSQELAATTTPVLKLFNSLTAMILAKNVDKKKICTCPACQHPNCGSVHVGRLSCSMEIKNSSCVL